MINFLDDQLKNITDTMKELGMWENTLMVLSSDNGGFVKSPNGVCNATDASFPGAVDSTDYGHGTACFSAANPDVVTMMKAEMQKQAATIWSTSHSNDPGCKAAAETVYGGFYGPWKEL